MDEEEISRLNSLACSKEYLEIKKELLQYIVSASTSTIDPLIIKGMLMLLNVVDKWKETFDIKKSKERNK